MKYLIQRTALFNVFINEIPVFIIKNCPIHKISLNFFISYCRSDTILIYLQDVVPETDLI